MIAELRAGQKVVFAGGLSGTITEAKESTFMVEIAPKVVIEVARGAVSQVVQNGKEIKVEQPR
jgi:preprotein translocase YajC subunit